jgi:hypothetical protein
MSGDPRERGVEGDISALRRKKKEGREAGCKNTIVREGRRREDFAPNSSIARKGVSMDSWRA